MTDPHAPHLSVLYEYGSNNRPHGSAYIRSILPFSHPSVGSSLRVTFDTQFTPANIILVERTWHPYFTLDVAYSLLRQIRTAGSKLMYSVDDCLLDTNRFYPYRQVFTDEIVAASQLLTREADLLIVSTHPLKKRLANLNPNIEIISNHLDDQLFSKTLNPKKKSSLLTLGYMGTPSHKEDLWLILEPLRKLLTHSPLNLALEICGVYDDHTLKKLFGDLPVKAINPKPEDVEYPAFIKWMQKTFTWDIGLAPLQDNEFTRCKSDIKWLDYGIQGIPGIFSRVPAYEHSILHNQTGLLADNTPDAWYMQLEELTQNADKRNKIQQNAFEYIWNHRTLSQHTHKWLEAVMRLC